MADKSSHKFARRLIELRHRAGMTQQVLADRAGIALRTVSSYERGSREPSLRSMMALASALGVSLNDLAADPETDEPLPERGRPRKDQAASDDDSTGDESKSPPM